MYSIQELRSSTKKELLLELAKARKENLKIRVSLKTKHEKDSSKAEKLKHYVAQILTILTEIKDEKEIPQNIGQPKSDKKKSK